MMDDTSVFMDKACKPAQKDLVEKLGSTHQVWVEISDFVMDKYPGGMGEWNYPGKKYGWSYRIKDKKRVIIYLLPRDNYFKVAMIFGQKSVDIIMDSSISPEIKNELAQAKKYAEGQGIRIAVQDDSQLADIKKLVEIKLGKY